MTEVEAFELDLVKQMNDTAEGLGIMEPTVSKKRKRDNKVEVTSDPPLSPQEGGEGDAKRMKLTMDEPSLDPITEAADALEAAFEQGLMEMSFDVPGSSLVPIVRPDAPINIRAPVKKDSKSSSKQPIATQKKDKKKPAPQIASVEVFSSPPEEAEEAEEVEGDDPFKQIMDAAFAGASTKTPQKKACFYEQEGLEYSSCEEEDEDSEDGMDVDKKKPPVSLLDDMNAEDVESEPVRMPVVKLVQKKKKRHFGHVDYVKMDAECIFCTPIKVNKIFNDAVATALNALTNSDLKASKCAKQAHVIYKQGYKSLKPDEIKRHNIPLMTSRHMIRHIGEHMTDPDSTSRRAAERGESTIRQLDDYKFARTEVGLVPNIKLIESVAKIDKDIVSLRTKLKMRRSLHQVSKPK
jgi:hypothetical protein